MNVKKIIDLSQSLCEKEFRNPGLPDCKIDLLATHDKDGWQSEIISAGLHAGTHIDASFHKVRAGKKISDYPLERFLGEGLIVDLFNKNPGSEITPDDLSRYSDKIKKGDIVLLCTGWGLKKNIGDREEYIYNSPWLGSSACEFLIEKEINAVGIDHFSIGGMKPENVTIPHDLLLSSDILIFEDLLLPWELLEKERWFIVALPLKIYGVSGSFSRIIAIDFC
jgi:arylformamidase